MNGGAAGLGQPGLAGGALNSMGGALPSGGAASTGGTLGATASGGAPSTGGVPAAMASGGTMSTGGTTVGGGGMAAEVGGGGNMSGSGGAPDSSTGGAPNVDGSGGAGGSVAHTISVDDPVPGFASVAGGTTGGGLDLARAVSVSSMTELRNAASGSSPAIVLVQPGIYAGELAPSANKTIVGVGPGVKISGNLKISGSDRNNIIVRNIAVQGEPCSSYDACKAGADGVYVGNGAHHVWLDHLDVSDGQDGNCDITQGGDYVTVSWTHFHYTYDKEHRFSNLIAGSDDEPASVGKLHITYMNSHWGERIDQRQPRGRFGNIHMLNNYHNTGGSQIHGVGKDMALIAENSVYDEKISIWKDMGSPRGWQGIGNIGTGQDLNASYGTVFTIPYDYTAIPASEVVATVMAAECGAGNTCQFVQ